VQQIDLLAASGIEATGEPSVHATNGATDEHADRHRRTLLYSQLLVRSPSPKLFGASLRVLDLRGSVQAVRVMRESRAGKGAWQRNVRNIGVEGSRPADSHPSCRT
jgi:hypothetical protein